MRTQFERDDVKVAVFQDNDGKVERIDVNVANGLHEVVVKRVMRDGERQWEIKGATLASRAICFEDIWDGIPDFVEIRGRRYYVLRVVSEVVDATGKVTPAGNALSSARANIEQTVADFKNRFLGDQTMKMMKELLEAEGYVVKPDRNIMKKLGDKAYNCCAYHEIAGDMFDRVFCSGKPVTVEDMLMMSAQWAVLHDVLDN